MQTDLGLIKKHYGEKMMHLCKTLFPTILENDGALFRIISSKFAYSKLLYDDLIKQNKILAFQTYISSFAERDKNIHESNLDPFYLMDKAGYQLFECHNEEDVRKFKKYYRPDEELCSFYGNRTHDHYVFFAVKKNVDEIKREKFIIPDRQDEYGTSVISIQFTKGKYNNLSIKNRYNDSVMKADATFSNNLDNIIPGLTDSFQKKYHLNISFTDFEFELDNYCYAKDGKFYKYNYDINDVYYGCNNTIIDIDRISNYDREKYIIVDYFIIDLVNKRIYTYDQNIKDSFQKIPLIKKILITKNDDGKDIKIFMGHNYAYLSINKNNQIIKYESDLQYIGDDFLQHNKTLNSFKNEKLIKIGNNFLGVNRSLTSLNLPSLEVVGDYFLSENTELTDFDFPNLIKCGQAFLRCCNKEIVTFPKLVEVGSSFISSNHFASELYVPNLRETGSFFMNFNSRLKILFAPKLEKVGHHFLMRNKQMESLYLPNLHYADDYFMFDNTKINTIYLPELEKIGDSFLQHDYALRELNLPEVLEIGNNFMDNNRLLEKINLPLVTRIGDNFLRDNDHLKTLDLPKLLIIGNNTLKDNTKIIEVRIPNLKICGNYFLYGLTKIKTCLLNSNINPGWYFLGEALKNNQRELPKQLVKKLKY